MRNISNASLLLTTCALGVLFGACSSEDPDTQPTTNGVTSNTTTNTTQGGTTTGTSTATATSGSASTSGTATATATATTGGTVTTTGTVTGTSATVTSTTSSTTTTGSSSSSGSTTGGGCSAGQVDCGAGCVDVLAGPIERSGSYVLEFGDLYFAAVAAGGKVLEFKRAGGANVFTTDAAHETNFGSTLWTAPQADWNEWPPVPEIDSEPYTVTVDDAAGTITMVSMGTPTVGPNVTVTKVFTANPCDETIDISYSIANSGTTPVSFSAWEVTRVLPGGLSFWGAEEGLLGESDLPAEYETDTYWFDHMVDETGDRKLFSEGTQGYIAFTQGTDLFVKSFSDVPATGHPPNHGEVEVYEDLNDGYVELEIVGSYGEVAAGASATLETRWYLRPMPDGATRAVGDAALKAAVLELIAP